MHTEIYVHVFPSSMHVGLLSTRMNFLAELHYINHLLYSMKLKKALSRFTRRHIPYLLSGTLDRSGSEYKYIIRIFHSAFYMQKYIFTPVVASFVDLQLSHLTFFSDKWSLNNVSWIKSVIWQIRGILCLKICFSIKRISKFTLRT